MFKCNCNTMRGIGIHAAECNIFVGLTFEDFANKNLKDYPHDLFVYSQGFGRLLDERPEFYAAAMNHQLQSELREVFDANDFQGTAQAMIAVHKEWFAAHFTSKRLKALRDANVIAQEYGFATSTLIGFEVEVKHFFGIYDND